MFTCDYIMPLNVNINQYRNNYQNNNLCFQQEEKDDDDDDETNKFNQSLFNDYIDINEKFISKAHVNENKKLSNDSNKTDIIVSNYSSSFASYKIRRVPVQLLKTNLSRLKIIKNMNNLRMKKIFKLILNYFLLFVFVLMIYLVFVQAYILFQNTVGHSNLNNHYRNPKLSNDFSSNQLIQKSINDQKFSNEEFLMQMGQIKSVINKLYSSIENPIDYCPNEKIKLNGELNVLKIMDQFNLTNLVEFHDNTTYNTKINQYVKNELYYVNGFNISNKNVSARDIEFYNLWHSNDMVALNISNFYLGEDGSRVELGKFIYLKVCFA